MEKDFTSILKNSSTDVGFTRLSYSREDEKTRDYLKNEFKKIGGDFKEDSVGNIRASYNPKKLNTKTLLIGSHIDTVPNGGKYDGLTGVISALEVLRIISENHIDLKHPIELIIFAEEEGSNFGVTMIGSKYITNKIKKEDLKKLYTDSGETAYEYIESRGFEFDKSKDFPIDNKNELAMIELHVEQGGILDKENKSIGIVRSIAGMNSLKVSLKGRANHAGTTPMSMRKDSLLVASEIISKIPTCLSEKDSAVATVGKINVKPNASNVIAGETVFFVDIRDVIQENIEKITKDIQDMCKSLASSHDLDLEMSIIGSSNVIKMDQELVEILEKEAIKNKIKFKKMDSGAVHDNAMLNDLISTAMIFVPSIDGISHSPYEETRMEDIILGTKLLLDTCLKLIKED